MQFHCWFQVIPKLIKDAWISSAGCCTPFVEGVSHSLRCYLQEHGIRTVFKSKRTQRKHLVLAIDSVPQGKQDGVTVVYMIPCSDCDSVYNSETGRAIQERTKEHERASAWPVLKHLLSIRTCQQGRRFPWMWKHQMSKQKLSLVFTKS